jgi:3-oxoacyl-[acyl-carrier protein] reductase
MLTSTIAMKPFWEIDPGEWDQLMAVNLRGVWLAATAVVEVSMREHGGVIVNVSSGVVHIGRRDYAHYVASKGGVMALSRSMARELGDFGVRVNSITPGPVYTEVPRDTVTPEQKQAIANAQCIKRPAEPEDLTGVVAFLASDDARFLSGQTINVDGGLTTY